MSIPQQSFKCIAVDMGAGSIRVMLGVIDRDGISFSEVHRITNEIVELGGRDHWDMERIVPEIRMGISNALQHSDDQIKSIGVDSWGVDYVMLDDRGELVETPVAYRDSRTVGMREKWKNLMPEKETFGRTGINFYLFNTLFQLLSSRDTAAMKRTHRILFIPCYINYLLSGQALNELTISSTSQLLAAQGDQWDKEILQKLGVEEELLGEVIPPGTRLGPVLLPEFAERRMESIAVCGHDTACVVAAIPVVNPNYAFISAGTWCVVGVESDHPMVGEEALQLGFTNERGYNNSYRVLKNVVGLWLIQGLKKHLNEGISYSMVEEMTRTGDQVLQVIDPDDPVFYNPRDMKKAFDQFFITTGQAQPTQFSAYLICAYDSLCFSFRYHIEKLESLWGRGIEVLHVVGGGSQSDYLNQRIATICGRKVISGPVEGATLGNILIQALSLGAIASLQEGRELVKRSFKGKSYQPEEGSDEIEKRYRQFLRIKETHI